MDFDNICQEKERAEIHSIGNTADEGVPEELNRGFIALGEEKRANAVADRAYHPIAPWVRLIPLLVSRTFLFSSFDRFVVFIININLPDRMLLAQNVAHGR